jgi:hypothetical protein
MKKTIALATASGLLLAAPAVAQSATASLTASSNTVAAGSSVTVSVVVDFTTGGAGSGSFGMAGLYGFGGDAVASGDAAADTSASSVSTAAFLPLGPLAVANVGSTSIATVAGGRLLADGALTSSPQTVATFSVDIDAAASAGDTVTIDYDGAVVLALDNDLVTFATVPGANQQTLSTNALTLTIGGGRLCADQNADGIVSPADFNAWILNFNQGSLVADTNQDGLVSPADFNGWILAFNQGVNGPTCSP